MRLLIATLVLAMPAMSPTLAAAQEPIPEGILQEHMRACVSECSQNREREFCIQTCNCVTAEMRDNWTVMDYQEREAGLQGEMSSRVKDELRQMTAYCMQSMQ